VVALFVPKSFSEIAHRELDFLDALHAGEISKKTFRRKQNLIGTFLLGLGKIASQQLPTVIDILFEKGLAQDRAIASRGNAFGCIFLTRIIWVVNTVFGQQFTMGSKTRLQVGTGGLVITTMKKQSHG